MVHPDEVDRDCEHLARLIRDFRTAMFVMRGANGEIHSRPLTLAGLGHDCTLYFPVARNSLRWAQVEDQPQVNVSLQTRDRFVSISGRAKLSSDGELISRFWSDGWMPWFAGRDDPELVMLTVTPHTAEYWDERGIKGLRYIFAAARQTLQGTMPEPDGERRHATITFD